VELDTGFRRCDGLNDCFCLCSEAEEGNLMITIKRLNSTDADFKAQLDELLAFEGAQDEKIDQTVAAILADVKSRGDAAVIEYTNRSSSWPSWNCHVTNWKPRWPVCRLIAVLRSKPPPPV
jgi:hypothetical protein